MMRDIIESKGPYHLEREDAIKGTIGAKVCEVTQVDSGIIEEDAKSLKVPVPCSSAQI
jgi:hypothetical protein